MSDNKVRDEDSSLVFYEKKDKMSNSAEKSIPFVRQVKALVLRTQEQPRQ